MPPYAAHGPWSYDDAWTRRRSLNSRLPDSRRVGAKHPKAVVAVDVAAAEAVVVDGAPKPVARAAPYGAAAANDDDDDDGQVASGLRGVDDDADTPWRANCCPRSCSRCRR